MAAMETATASPSGTDRTGGRSATGEKHRWKRPWTLVSGPLEGFDRWVLAQPTRTAVYGPVRTVVWQGSAGDRSPLPINEEL
jgi:hypothetical protein